MNAPINMPPPPLTGEEFALRYAGQSVELVDGQVIEVPMPSTKHGRICLVIARLIDEVAERGGLGRVMTNDSFIRVQDSPEKVRGADVTFYSYERLPRGPVPEGLLPVSPDLVVEVRSPSDTWDGVFIKVGEYLRANVTVVIVLDAATSTASTCRREAGQQIFKTDEELTIPDVLPGFAVAVRRLFEG